MKNLNMNIRTIAVACTTWLAAQSPPVVTVDELIASGRYIEIARPANDKNLHAIAAWAFARHFLAPGKESSVAAAAVHAKTGDALAAYVLLDSLPEGQGVRRDATRLDDLNRSLRRSLASKAAPSAMELFVLAKTTGIHMEDIANLDDFDDAVSMDNKQRRDWLEAAAKAGFAQAVNDIGRMAQDKKDFDAAARNYERAAQIGLAEGNRNLGRLRAKCVGGAEDLAAARELALRAAEAGDALAMTDLAYYLDQGIGGAADRAAAQQWLERGAKSGHWCSLFEKGKALLVGGYGLAVDRDAGLRCLEQAVASRCGPALLRVAEVFAHGEGIPADGRTAIELGELAFVQGSDHAASLLAELYTRGIDGVVRDEDMALFWRLRENPMSFSSAKDLNVGVSSRLEHLDPFSTPIQLLVPK